MDKTTQAAVFIRTLADMLDDERQRREARLRAQTKAQAERFRQAYRANADNSGTDSGFASEWPGSGGQTSQQAVQRRLDR